MHGLPKEGEIMNEFRYFPFMKNSETYVRFFVGDKFVDLKLKDVEKLDEDLKEILACDPREDL